MAKNQKATNMQKDALKILLTTDGLLLGAKMLTPMLPSAILGIAIPQYMMAMFSIGILTTGYSKYKEEKAKMYKEKELTESDLFELED